MPKLVELLKKNKFTLIVDLPENQPELALAAIKGGADALQIGPSNAEKLIKLSKLPVGIRVESAGQLTKEEVKKLVKAGADFINVKRDDLPEYFSSVRGVAKVLGLGNRFTVDLILGIGENGADALDAAIIPSEAQGKDLKVGDLQNYISIVIASGIPVIIPTQLAIRPSEVAILTDTEAKGLLLTPIVLGLTAEHIEKNVREFRAAVDELE
jgi:hypothetical protein